MTIFYITIFCLAAFIEFSTKCNTSNLIKKTGLGFIMIGALVSIVKPNMLIEIGCSLMLSSELIKAYFATRDRRKTDNLPRKRKLLS